MGFEPERAGGAYMVSASRNLSGGSASLKKVLAVTLVMASCAAMTGCASKPKYVLNDSPAAQTQTDSGRSGKKKHHGKDRQTKDDRQQTPAADESTMRSSTDQDNNWGDAFTAPLEDLNLKRQTIPAILTKAISKPYDLTGLDSCEAIASEVAQLDILLGADFDEPPPPANGDETLTDKGQRMANHAAVGAVRSASRSIIPFRGLVRKMTGAEAHEKEVDTAIQAGKVRRAYLKGVGMNKNCAPPAAPSWFKPRVYVQTYGDGSTSTPPVQNETPPGRKRRTR